MLACVFFACAAFFMYTLPRPARGRQPKVIKART